MNAWFVRHLQTCIGSLGRLMEQRLATALTILVIGIALALPACLQIVIANARSAGGDLSSTVDISVYLKAGTSAEAADQVAAALRLRSDIGAVQLIKADEGLKEFSQRSGFGDALKALNDNPLPHALVVQPAAAQMAPDRLQSLAQSLRSITEVDVVQVDTAWVERLHAILDVLKRTGWVVGLLLGFGVLVIVSNVVRTDIQSRRAEIEIAKLVGATDAFVRRPFLYTGVWYGFGGGVIALTLSYAVVAVLAPSVRHLAGLYGSGYGLQGLAFVPALALVGLGMLLGWLGSWVSTTKHLREIEPQ